MSLDLIHLYIYIYIYIYMMMIFLRVLVLTLWEGDATFLMLTFEVTHRCKTRGIRFGRRNYDWGSFYFYISIWIWLRYPHLHVLTIYHSILSTLYFFAMWYGELCCFFHAPEVNQSTSNSPLQKKSTSNSTLRAIISACA